MNRLSVRSILLLVLAASCQNGNVSEGVKEEPMRVKIEPVRIQPYQVPIRTTGLLGTTAEMKLSFKTGGLVESVAAREGETVRKGTVLAKLDLSEIRAQAEQARIGMEKAERDLQRAKNLYNDSVATLEQYQNAQSAFELAVAGKRVADFNLEHSQIRAPRNGKVLKKLVEPNEMIAPGYPAILFGSTENDWIVRASLTDKDVVKLSIGDSGIVTMDAFPEIRFRAEVTELGSVADPLTGSYEAELLIAASRPQFRNGFVARLLIYPRTAKEGLMIPVDALLDARDNKANVYRYTNGTARLRSIVTGPIVGDRIVVSQGLVPGDTVITEGVNFLRKDGAVRPVN